MRGAAGRPCRSNNKVRPRNHSHKTAKTPPSFHIHTTRSLLTWVLSLTYLPSTELRELRHVLTLSRPLVLDRLNPWFGSSSASSHRHPCPLPTTFDVGSRPARRLELSPSSSLPFLSLTAIFSSSRQSHHSLFHSMGDKHCRCHPFMLAIRTRLTMPRRAMGRHSGRRIIRNATSHLSVERCCKVDRGRADRKTRPSTKIAYQEGLDKENPSWRVDVRRQAYTSWTKPSATSP